MRPLTQDDCDALNARVAEKFGDLMPDGKQLTPEMGRQLLPLVQILSQVSHGALAGALAASMLDTYGKAAPLIARRMVEVYGELDDP